MKVIHLSAGPHLLHPLSKPASLLLPHSSSTPPLPWLWQSQKSQTGKPPNWFLTKVLGRAVATKLKKYFLSNIYETFPIVFWRHHLAPRQPSPKSPLIPLWSSDSSSLTVLLLELSAAFDSIHHSIPFVTVIGITWFTLHCPTESTRSRSVTTHPPAPLHPKTPSRPLGSLLITYTFSHPLGHIIPRHGLHIHYHGTNVAVSFPPKPSPLSFFLSSST